MFRCDECSGRVVMCKGYILARHVPLPLHPIKVCICSCPHLLLLIIRLEMEWQVLRVYNSHFPWSSFSTRSYPWRALSQPISSPRPSSHRLEWRSSPCYPILSLSLRRDLPSSPIALSGLVSCHRVPPLDIIHVQPPQLFSQTPRPEQMQFLRLLPHNHAAHG